MPRLVKDLKAHAGKSVVIPGLYQDASVAALAYSDQRGAREQGRRRLTADLLTGKRRHKLRLSGLKSLVADLNAGKVDWMVILNSNPIYSAPADLEFAAAFDKAKIVAHLGSHLDETGQIAHWHIPAAHFLESWSDARSYDGTVSIVQPLIDPLYGGKTAHHVFQTLMNEPMVSPYDSVRETWKSTDQG